jgi:hypothetical protein
VPSLGASSTVSVIVTAQDGASKKTYVLTLTQANRNDATLSALTESAGALTGFSPATLAYAFNVPFQTAAYKVTATTSDALATLTVNGSSTPSGQAVTVPLSVGANTVTLVVTAADHTATKTYVLTITEGNALPGLAHPRTVPLAAATPLAVASGARLPANQAVGVPVDTLVPTLPTPSTVVTGATGATFTNYTTSITQAETIYFNTTYSVTAGVGSAGTLIGKHSNFISYQDTLQLKGFSWFYDCFIAGDTDFIWGNANTALFERSEIRARFNPNGASMVQPRAYLGFGTSSTAPTASNTSYPGFVFLGSALTKDPGTYTAFLARSNGPPAAPTGSSPAFIYTGYDIVTFIGCSMDTHVDPKGWNLSAISGSGGANIAPNVVTGWREYGTVTPAGAPYDTSSRYLGGSGLLGGAVGQVSDVNTWFKDRATIFAGATDGSYTTLGLAGFSPTP